jgi:hypothetical protein
VVQHLVALHLVLLLAFLVMVSKSYVELEVLEHSTVDQLP